MIQVREEDVCLVKDRSKGMEVNGQMEEVGGRKTPSGLVTGWRRRV